MFAIPIISELIGLGKTYLESRSAKNKAKATAFQKAAENDHEMQKLLLEQNHDSWKDEYLTVLITLPFILVFFPNMQPYIIDGFEALKQLPEWYEYSLLAAIATGLGIKGFNKFSNPK